MRFSFCPLCGQKLIACDFGDDKNVPFCESCKHPFFVQSRQSVIVIPVCGDKIALTRQSYGDTDRFVLTAGFIGEKETAENAAAREVFEELGLKSERVIYLKSYYHEKSDNLMLGFVSFVKPDDFVYSAEVRDAKWVTLDESRELLQGSSVACLLANEYMNFLKTHNNLY